MQNAINEILSRYLNDETSFAYFDSKYAESAKDIVVTTDGFTADPIAFPGGDIGSLMIYGTVNDLAVRGAKPLFITINAFIEESVSSISVEKIAQSLSATARECAVRVVLGETQLVPARRGHYEGMHFAVTGIGTRLPVPPMNISHISPGDALIVSGPIGSHGVAVSLVQHDIESFGVIYSDCNSIFPMACQLFEFHGLRVLREPTQGGLAKICQELARASGMGIRLTETCVPIRKDVQHVCEQLGYDPFKMASEGQFIAVIAADQAESALAALHRLPEGQQAAIIGYFEPYLRGVYLEDTFGHRRDLTAIRTAPATRLC